MSVPAAATSLARVAPVTHVLRGGAAGGFRESQRVSGPEQRTLSEFQCPVRVPSPGTVWGVGALWGLTCLFGFCLPLCLSVLREKRKRGDVITLPVDFLPVDALSRPTGVGVALPTLQMRKQAPTSKD